VPPRGVRSPKSSAWAHDDWGQVVARPSSTEVTDRNPLAHDGLAVLSPACRRLGSSDLSGCTFYGTAERCPMCSAALLQTRIGQIVLGASGSALANLRGHEPC
jgi:tRNA(Arg) A34 adenosine deaminase TadA